jgi:hypothetical protein
VVLANVFLRSLHEPQFPDGLDWVVHPTPSVFLQRPGSKPKKVCLSSGGIAPPFIPCLPQLWAKLLPARLANEYHVHFSPKSIFNDALRCLIPRPCNSPHRRKTVCNFYDIRPRVYTPKSEGPRNLETLCGNIHSLVLYLPVPSFTSSQHLCDPTTMEFHPKLTCLFQQSRPRKVERRLIWTPVSSRSNEDLIANILLQPYQAAKPLSINSRNTTPLYLGSTPTIFNFPDHLEVTTRNGSSSHSVGELWKPENFTNELEATSFFYETPTWQATQSNPIPPLDSEPTMSSWLNATCTDSSTPNLQLEHTLGLWPIQDWTESCLIAAGEGCPLQTYADGQLDLNQEEGFGYDSIAQSSKSCMVQHSLPIQGFCGAQGLSEIFIFGSAAQNDHELDLSPLSTNDFLNISPIDRHSSEHEQPSTDSELLEVPQLSNADYSLLSMQEAHIPQLSNLPELLSTAILDDTPVRSTEPQLTFADHIITFDLKPTSRPLKRKRSAFSLEGKKKVRSVRQNGACVSCRSRKISVS